LVCGDFLNGFERWHYSCWWWPGNLIEISETFIVICCSLSLSLQELCMEPRKRKEKKNKREEEGREKEEREFFVLIFILPMTSFHLESQNQISTVQITTADCC
jgi:hypothetical protein